MVDLKIIVSARMLCVGVIFLVGACTTLPPVSDQSPIAYVAEAFKVDAAFARYSPVFVHENDDQSYNRVGHAVARRDHNGDIKIAIDPGMPKIYTQRTEFVGKQGSYTNLIYRVHFERVPHSLIPFHITAGKNGGLLVVVTLNTDGRPVLYTTVHTCGCYLGFIPTNHLPAMSYPESWPESEQKVYGEHLPARISFDSRDSEYLYPVITLKNGTHRIKGIELLSRNNINDNYRTVITDLEPVGILKRLPFEDQTVSFYNTAGFKKGYVRNTVKPWELLLMSWWALDFNVGVDKEYGDSEQTGTIFYTSLKPWRRRDSDMWHFAEFLKYWGWRL